MRTDTEFLPLTGSPVRLDGLAAASARSAAALDATGTDLRRIGDALGPQRAASVDAARTVVEDLHTAVALSDDVLRTLAAALSGRAAALAQEQQDAAAALARRDAALARLARAEADEADAWHRLAADGFPAGPTLLLWQARDRAAAARADVAAAESDWRRARDAKESGSRWVAARIRALVQVRAVQLAAAEGVGAVAFATSWQVGRSLATSLQGTPLRDQSRAPRPELLTSLRTLGDDPVAWQAFWEHVEAEDVYRAFAGAPPGSAGAVALREGVEAAATGQTAAEQEAFGRFLVEGYGTPGADGGARAALLAGMLGGALPATVHAGAADALVERRSQLGTARELDATVLASVAQAVADGLAADPERALEHLVGDSPEVAAHRARFWFGERPGAGWSDGGVAVAGLLTAAVAAGSSPTATPARRADAATVIGTATPELVRSTGLLTGPGPLHHQVETNVVRAYEPYIPSFGDAVSPEEKPTGLAAEPDYVEPDLDPSTLCAVIGATSRSAHGAGVWLGTTDDYRAEFADTLAAPSVDSGPRMHAISGAATDAVVVAGAVQSTALLEAEGRQRLFDAAVVGGTTAVSFATAGASTAVSIGATALTSSVPVATRAFGIDFVSESQAHLALAEEAALDRYLTPLVETAHEADVAAGYPADDSSRLPTDAAVRDVFRSASQRSTTIAEPEDDA
ncbi:hypothetical protein ACNHYB_10465 [Isoptericola jiangsuensis]|uniref:hypothetical protein n=1 Tax=Isoptericola jiangsuensis TaxID=548579 RepID=UPI003AAD5E4A